MRDIEIIKISRNESNGLKQGLPGSTGRKERSESLLNEVTKGKRIETASGPKDKIKALLYL